MKILKLIFSLLIIGTILNAQNTSNIDTLLTLGPGSYEVLISENDIIKVPFKMHNGKPLMELEINGEKATLMIDNGILWNQVWLFGSPLIKKLTLNPVIKDSMAGNSAENSTSLYSSNNLKLNFKHIIFYEQPVLVSPSVAGYAKMFPGADGQLCNTFFKHFIVEFDFIQNEIFLHNPQKFNYKGNGSILDMQLTETGTYSVPFEITMKDGTVYKDRVDIDLGGIYSFKIALNKNHDIQPPSDAQSYLFFGGTEYKAKIENINRP
ncbi:hypothetical protein [Lentimicrobium sp. S6]|uniref:hypothetical protein n=1 Tax=Lentimicrobium sp. S6 TaxID=2735872 RepID=UPI0015528F85|nr:hypothetical protein [Lentimicrobium sp. S6]NPD47300.1 hypothetical protein [Lentimicrobium sp. S6]